MTFFSSKLTVVFLSYKINILTVKFEIIHRRIKKIYQKSHHPDIITVTILNIFKLFLHTHTFTVAHPHFCKIGTRVQSAVLP